MLRSVEFHHFFVQDRFLLFNVNELTVIPSETADRPILETINSCRSIEALVRTLSPSFGEANIRRRLRALRKHRFLLQEHEKPQFAQAGKPTEYATFMVNVSQRCNLTCRYCYVNKGEFDYAKRPIPRMEASTAEVLVEKIHKYFPGLETYGFHFYGGEPLLNFEAIKRIVVAAERIGIETHTKTDYHITTNGTLLTPDVADFMDRHKFTVYFSIDGDEKHHDELRKYKNGRGSFQAVEKNLKYLRTKPKVHLIGSSVIRDGFTLSEALRLLEEHGAAQCKAERVRLPDGQDLSLKGSDHDKYLADVKGMLQHYVESLEAGRKPMDFRLSSKILQMLTKTRRTFFCPAGERMFGISSNGEIYPCALHVGRPQSKIGDVENGIDLQRRSSFRQRFGWQGQKDCRLCWTRHLCGGGCSAMVDRFGHEDCSSLRAESEAAIAIYEYFASTDPVKLYALVSPKLARWASGELDDPAELRIDESPSGTIANVEKPPYAERLYQITL